MALSDNEIIKAMEHCQSNDTISGCVGCPIDVKDCLGCNEDVAELSGYLVKRIVDLINRQKSDIRKYKNCYEQVKWERDLFEEQCKTAKADAIKEFIEKMVEHMLPLYVLDEANSILKEMVDKNDL